MSKIQREGAGAKTSQAAESVDSITEAPNAANNKDTAQKYICGGRIKVDFEDIERKIQDRALFYLGIAAAAGFVAGGGMASKMGVVLLGLVARKKATETALTSADTFSVTLPEAPKPPHSAPSLSE